AAHPASIPTATARATSEHARWSAIASSYTVGAESPKRKRPPIVTSARHRSDSRDNRRTALARHAILPLGMGRIPMATGRVTLSCAPAVVSAILFSPAQPLSAKMVLPLLGGAPAVWNTCLVFFQIVLLGGYAYSHLLCSRLRLPAQTLLHLVLTL